MSATAANLREVPSVPALAMRNNIARDIVSRSSDFGSVAVAIFEYIANGYEGYDRGQDPAVAVSVKNGLKGSVSVRDIGRGMDAEGMAAFWTMHGQTKRRAEGLNSRGYHGTGKIAAFSYADELRVDSVRGGLRNVHVLSREAIDAAVESGEPPRIDVLAHEVPTDAPNGTTVTVSRFHTPVLGTVAKDIADKVAHELPLWMHGAAVTVNGALVEVPPLAFDRSEPFREGPFSATVSVLDAGYEPHRSKVFYHCGGVFIAMDEAGKEGHRFARKVHVKVDTTAEWAEEHFNHSRERFVSEARDLRLKRQHAAAARLAEFAERTVRAYMAKLDAEDRAQRRDVMSEALRLFEDDLAKALTADWRLASMTRAKPREKDSSDGPSPTPVARRKPDTDAEPREPRAPKPRVGLRFVDFAGEHPHYRVDQDSLSIEVNTAHPTAKLLAQLEDTRGSAIYLLGVTVTAYAELLALDELKRKMDDDGAVVFQEMDSNAMARAVLQMRNGHESRLLAEFGPRFSAAART